MAQRILLVEDEPALRTIMVRSLAKAGFEVLEAENGADGLAKLEQTHGDIDLLLTDLNMPMMNGVELGRQAISRHPKLAILFTSGYADGIAREEHLIPDSAHLIEKPFTPSQLVDRVKELLPAKV